MTNTELVIKIPEEKLGVIKNKMYCGIYDPDLYKAIANGVPLPKGHGQLIDVDALLGVLQKFLDERCKDAKFTGNRDASVTWDDAIHYIKSAPPIIEAERREE